MSLRSDLPPEGRDERAWILAKHEYGSVIRGPMTPEVLVVPKACLDAALAESEARRRELEERARRAELQAHDLTVEAERDDAERTALVEALRARDDLLRRCLPFVAEHGGAYPERDEIEAILNGPALVGVIEAEPDGSKR